MSLEAALTRNSDLLERLIATLQSGALPGAPATTDTTTKPRANKKADTPAPPPAAGAATLNDGKSLSVKLVAGDKEGTRYFHIAAHNTVAAVEPGGTIPNITGAIEIDGDEYTTLKASYAAQFPTSAAGAPAQSPAAAPAAATPPASPASSTTPGASAATGTVIDGPALTAKCKELHGKLGNDGLKKVLDHFKADKVGTLVTKSAEYPAIVKFIDGLMNPQPETAADPAKVDLF